MYFNLGDRIIKLKLVFLHNTVKLKVLKYQSSWKHRMALEFLIFYSQKGFDKSIPACMAKGSKENQRTFRSSWSNVVAILKQSERGDLETKFNFLIACALYVPPLLITDYNGLRIQHGGRCDARFQSFFMVKFLLKSLQDV